ncbi:tudor domain-containing protein 15 [Parambassis ranga]|uniref:Tudor domain-containing protein 15 n=1 Tax=Parambassis ranga TaxID=210632 RepID=A0A6P7HIF0_9TELE|nr:tudor domain-containing protein 15 [Parambassis ranga]
MWSKSSPGHPKSQGAGPPAPCALWPVDLKLTHLDWNPKATLIHFQGQYHTICELDYKILQGEIQNVPKTEGAVDIGEFCLVEDFTSARWYRGRVQNREGDQFDIFLIDYGNVLSVDITHISSCSDSLFLLPPKIVSGFLANVLLLQSCSHYVLEEFFSSLIGKSVTGYIQALLPYKVLLLEAPDINSDLVRHGFGRHVDTDTFLFLVEMLLEVPLKQNQPVPDLLIEKPRAQELCFKQSGLQGYADILSFSGLRLSCGTRAKFRVTAAVNHELFYCQMVSMEKDLWEMSTKLAATCEHKTKERSKNLTPEHLGLLCSVKGKDEKWYRGLVQCLPVNSQVRVFLIDYGFFESVKVDNIYRLPPNFYSAPIMAFPCRLSSLTDQDEVLKAQQSSFLKAGLLGGVLDVEINCFDEEQHLYSITMFEAKANDVKEPEPIQKFPSASPDSFVKDEQLSPQGGSLYYETIIGDALNRTLEAEEVKVDSVFVGYVEHVQNPNHFWIRTQKRNGEFEAMMTEIKDHFSQVTLDEELDELSNLELGSLCCAVYEQDLHFYRGVVTDILKHGAKVLFIDFGNIEKVPRMLIEKIPERVASITPFALCCTLHNVFPQDEVWTSTASDFFRRTVSDKTLLVHVVEMRKHKLVVELFETGSDNRQSIAELLVASKQDEYILRKPVMHNDKRVAEAAWHPQCRNVADINVNKEQWNDSEPEETTSENKTKTCQVPASFRALSIQPGYELAVRCSHIISPSEFWCQPLNTAPALEKLMDELQQYYSVHTVPLLSGDSCCVAKSPQDGRWYRAFITAKQERCVTVMLVDYGPNIQVGESSLQAVVPEYVHLKEQTFRCSFDSLIDPADFKNCTDWSPSVCNLLKDFVKNRSDDLKCKVVCQVDNKNKKLCNVVDLYNTRTQQSITDMLIQQGLARRATISTKQQSALCPESFVYSSYGLSPGNEEQVYVAHVNSQWEVYCHLERNNEIIEELERKISEESERMMKGSAGGAVRRLCLAKYLDGKWYRGLIEPVQSSLHLSVFFVDYGNTQIVEKTNVMFIPRDSEDLLYTPMQAVRCNLSSVSKEELYADVKDWLNGAVLNKLVRAVILGKNEDGSFDVELFVEKVNVNDEVKKLIHTLSITPKTTLTFETGKTATKSKKEMENKQKNDLRRGRKKNLKPNQEKMKTSTCVKHQKSSHKKHQEHRNAKSEHPQHKEKTETQQMLCLHDKNMSAGVSVLCFVSHVDSVDSFFLQLSEDEPDILKMAEDLNSSAVRDNLETTKSLNIDDVVLAEYEEDGALYRSVVKNREGDSCFKVEFVDYGNSAVVGKEKIYSIPKKYLSQPRFSVPCSLLDTSTFKNDASFVDAVMEKPLMVDFVHQYKSQWEVKMEILGAECGLTIPFESAGESSPAPEREKPSPMSPSETEEKAHPCEQNYLGEEEGQRSKGTLSTGEDENLVLEPPSVMLNASATFEKSERPMSSDEDLIPKPSPGKLNDFIPQTIQAKGTRKGTIVSVQSNGCFYVRLSDASDSLATMESEINENLNQCKMVASEDIKQGLNGLVQVQGDKKWHRALVQQINEEKYDVFLVDHGITKEIPSGSLLQQCSSLAKIPKLALLCKMNSLEIGAAEEAQWCETLRSLIGKEVKLIFVYYSEAENLWMVDMVMNEVFLIPLYKAALQQHDKQIPSPAENQNEDSEKRHTMATSSPQKLIFAPVHTDQTYSGFAAAVATPFEFCVVPGDLLLIMNKVSVMLEELPEQIAPLPESHLITGTCCLLKSDSRNKWCRAEVVNADATVVLNLVDYGLHERIPFNERSKLKRLPVEISHLPKVTYPCILRGVKPVDTQWTDEAVVYFQQLLYQKTLQICFTEFVSNTHWKVDVVVDGVHVARKLVDAGHADYIDVMLGLRFQEQSPCKAPTQSLNSEEEEAADEAEGKMSHWSMSGVQM